MPVLIAATADHGEARYMLTGTNDFSYILDQMVDDGLIEASSATTTPDKGDLLSSYDGYRLKFTMIDMQDAITGANDDTMAICLSSKSGQGATCAGISYNGSSVNKWARWINWEIFYLAAVDGTFSEPEGQDDSAKWYLLDLSMDPDVSVTGAINTSWSIYRFQAIESENYDNDYRFGPSDSDIQPWIYKRLSDVHTFYPGATNFQLQGAIDALRSSVLISSAAVLAYSLF